MNEIACKVPAIHGELDNHAKIQLTSASKLINAKNFGNNALKRDRIDSVSNFLKTSGATIDV